MDADGQMQLPQLVSSLASNDFFLSLKSWGNLFTFTLILSFLPSSTVFLKTSVETTFTPEILIRVWECKVKLETSLDRWDPHLRVHRLWAHSSSCPVETRTLIDLETSEMEIAGSCLWVPTPDLRGRGSLVSGLQQFMMAFWHLVGLSLEKTGDMARISSTMASHNLILVTAGQSEVWRQWMTVLV